MAIYICTKTTSKIKRIKIITKFIGSHRGLRMELESKGSLKTEKMCYSLSISMDTV